MQREQLSQPLDQSLYSDGGHDRMNPLLRRGGIGVSLRECALPPEDLPQHANDVVGAQEKMQHKKRHKGSNKKRDKKKKSNKDKKDNRHKRPEHDMYQEVPTDSKSSKEKERKKHEQRRAIPESLTGREISWSRSYLKDAEDLPFHEDLVNARDKSHRRHRRRKSSDEAPPVREVLLDEIEGKKEEAKILLDRDGFPIPDAEGFPIQMKTKKDLSSKEAPSRISAESVASNVMSHAAGNFHDSMASVADSHFNNSHSTTDRSRMESLVHGSIASTEQSPSPRHTPGSPSGRLQRFLQKQGRDEMAAIRTAAAFEAFLKQQHDQCSDNDDSERSSHSWSFKEDLKCSSSDNSDDLFVESKLWGSESTLLDEDVKTFIDDNPNQDESGSFGLVRRNEAFVRRVSSKDLMKSTSDRTLRSSVFDTHSTTKTDRSFLTQSTLTTKESPSGKVLATKRPTKFAPYASTRSLDAIMPRERSVERQLASLSLSQRNCVDALKIKWESQNGIDHWFSDYYYLRFARCSPGHPFNFKTAWKVMARFDWRYYELSITKMATSILTKIAFPVPGLKTRGGRDVFYMRPSRFFPKNASTNDMIDLVVYVMSCMLEKEHGCVHGLGLVANMSGWKMENFSVSYWHKFLMTLQGHRVPTRISAFLLVDPPRWFDSIWTIMKPMMSDEFAEKVAVVGLDDLENYLMDGYSFHMPDDVEGGMLNTNALVQSFIAERKVIESSDRW